MEPPEIPGMDPELLHMMQPRAWARLLREREIKSDDEDDDEEEEAKQAEEALPEGEAADLADALERIRISETEGPCPICNSAAGPSIRLSEPREHKNRTGDFGPRFFCPSCEFDYMVYTGRARGVPRALCDMSLRNLVACRRNVLFHIEQVPEIASMPQALSELIASYTWFTMAACCFQHLPEFPVCPDQVMVRCSDAHVEHKAGDAEECPVKEITMPGDALVLQNQERVERYGLIFSRDQLPWTYKFFGIDRY